jgi:hypothetical protein
LFASAEDGDEKEEEVMASTDDILKKYGAKIESQMKGYDSRGQKSGVRGQGFSKSYERFKASMLPEFSRYERWCKAMGNFFTIKVGEKDRARIERSIEIAHLNLTASEVVVFSTMLLFLTLFSGVLFVLGAWLLGAGFSLMLLFFIFVFAVFLFFYSSRFVYCDLYEAYFEF